MDVVKIQKQKIIPPEKDIGTMFFDRVKRYGDRPVLTYKHEGRWKDLTWNETAELVQDVALGLMELKFEQGDMACILSETRVEWVYCYLGLASVGGICAGIYATNSPGQVQYILNDSRATLLFAEDQEQVDKILEIWGALPHLCKVIVFGRFSPKNDTRFMSLEELTGLGKKKRMDSGLQDLEERMHHIKQDDVVNIIYTSGTTGEPKGVVLAHFSFLYACVVWNDRMPISENDMGLASLPMSHVIGVLESLIWRLYYGCHICFAEDMTTVFVDILDVRPTYIFTTPRFYEKYYNRIVGMIEDAPWFRRVIIDFFLDIGFKCSLLEQRKERIPLYLKFLRMVGWLIFYRKIQDDFGGKIRFFLSVGAPIAEKIVKFMTSAGMPIYEGFGMTETVTVGLPALDDFRIGTVGKAFSETELKIAHDGELLIKTPGNCLGYWGKREETAELFKDGWLCSGDLAQIDENGYLSIIDRKKDIMINSSGKNIAPGHIENLLKTSRYISQAMVFGEGKKYVSALVTLDEDEVVRYARDNNVVYTGFAELTRKKKIIDLLQSEINIKNKDVARVERVKRFAILEEDFLQDEGEITATMKIRRKIVGEKYRDLIDRMY
ncbi:MAG: long-chain fatty acid--CoA ligase [Deltaproteobacteria bacterium]|nr:long-chain fatty acid--CoA ligase [Deltaproteobacteria bacterium]